MLIKEFSEKTGLSIDTLRYYEQEGLIAPQRNKQNYRIYSEKDDCWVQLLLKLKATHMSMEEMKRFSKLHKLGEQTEEERRDMLQLHLKRLNEQQNNLSETIQFVQQKIAHYQ